jgi:hypothetical protein
MTIAEVLREQVRKRADYACEFCGITETDAGGELTIDHYQPRVRGGGDNPDNLLYCCSRCNEYKHDYWATRSDDLSLWNPRLEPMSTHFVELNDGVLHPLTATGAFTLKQLRLNRPSLVAHRLHKRKQTEATLLLVQNEETIRFQRTVNRQLTTLMEEQQRLLEEQREFIRLLLGGRE